MGKNFNSTAVLDDDLVCSRVGMDNTWLLKEFMAMLKRYVGSERRVASRDAASSSVRGIAPET
jgi:hypothetical protein